MMPVLTLSGFVVNFEYIHQTNDDALMTKHWGKALAVCALLVLAMAGNAEAKNSIVIDGSTTIGPLAKSFAAYFTKTWHVPVTVSESGSGNGAKSLINGTCDIASMSRSMKPKELEAARSKGIEPVEHVIALDGLAIIIHPSNPVRALTRAQITEIYKGNITNWKQVGGPDFRILVIQRESNSGTQEAFKELVTGKKVRLTLSSETQASNGAMKNRVSLTPGAIGFISLGFVDSSVKKVAVEGVLPTPASVRDSTYPLARPLFMVTAGQPTGMVKRFIDMPDTPAGMRMIKELGFVNKP